MRFPVACAELDKDPRKASVLSPDHRRWAAADRARAGVAGAYVATGHSVWGILNAPATGEAMAELIVDGVAHNVDLQPFDPSRLPPVEPEAISEAAANLHRDRQKRRHPVGSNNNPAGSRDGIDDSGWALGLSMRDRTFARMLISRDSPRS